VNELVADLAAVRDSELLAEAESSRAERLLEAILAEPFGSGRAERRAARLLVAAVALGLAVILAAAALGGVGRIRSWLSGGHGADFPVPAGADVVVASGVAGEPWTIVATPSDQGLCLFLVTRPQAGSGGCGYLDVRGVLRRDLRGDPSTRCLATPTSAVPCGSLPRHWIDADRGSKGIVFAPAAEGVQRVELVLADGQILRAKLVERPGGLPLSVYWAELPPGQVVTAAIARDSTGRVLERRLPPWNGNPTGDPGGPKARPARRAA
jgi:hypothetical protein